MKMTLLTILFTILSLSLKAPNYERLVIVQPESVRPFESIWNATCKVESNFNPLAIGDRHLKNKSYGIAQIRYSRLNDFKERTGINYSLTDMYSPEKAKSVFMLYACEIGPYNMERISREWNGGIRGMQKKSTIKYWHKIQGELWKKNTLN